MQAHVRTIMVLTTFLAAGCHSREEPPEDEVDRSIIGVMTAQKIPAASVLVIKDGKVLKQKAYGMATIDPPTPATTETVFPLFSITKTFTAVGVLKLVDDGKIGLDDPIGGILEDLPEAWRPITMRQLLGHNSGLPDLLDDAAESGDRSRDRDEALRLVAGRALVSRPGERCVYLQTGYVLLGKIVEKTTGLSFADYMAREFFRPLGMSSTAYGNRRRKVRGRASSYAVVRYEKSGDAWKTTPLASSEPATFRDNPDYQDVGATLNSNTPDLIKWEAALNSGRLLRPETIKAMWTPSNVSIRTGGDWSDGMGLGWAVSDHLGHRSAFFSGGDATLYYRFLEDRVTIIILTNASGAKLNGLVARLVAICSEQASPHCRFSAN